MASKENKVKASKPRQRKGMKEETKVTWLKVLGLILFVFSVFTLIAVISYYISWWRDQSLFDNPERMRQAVAVANWGGKLGFLWADLLVAKCFGFGSLAIICLLGVASIRLFFRRNKWSFTKTLVLTLTAAIIISVAFAFAGSMFHCGNLFGGGLGGACGTVAADLLVNVLGEIVTGLILLVLVVLWLLYASGGFAKWFANLGEHERSPRPPKPVPVDDLGGSSKVSEGVDKVPDEPVDIDWPEEEKGKNQVPVLPPKPVAPPVQTPVQTGQPGQTGQGGQTGQTGGEDELVEVVDIDISTDVKKDLPRIDTREELSKYKFPSMSLLKDYSDQRYDVTRDELEENNAKIRRTLQNYGIGVDKVSACKGPVVTLYKVVPAAGTKISTIRSREEDIALSLGQKGVRVVTLKDVVGIEVPNSKPSIVPLKSLFNDPNFRNNKYELPVAMGFTITQEVKVFDLATAPHLLVAGATQQGKSVGLNVIIASLLYSKHPSEMKFVFIDPKMVEFNAYGHLLKHYLAVLPTAGDEAEERENAIVKNSKAADEVLRSLCVEMDERYKLMSKAMVNKVTMYNDKYRDRHLNPQNGHRYLPYLVVIIDEYADLLMSESKQMSRSISTSIVRLAQKGRAAGIHVILSTQRPTVDVVTGLIKTNFPMRIAFRTSAKIDSQTILDKPGAEKLIGKGDMLFYAGVEMERMQCAMIGMDEISSITEFIGSQTGYKQCYNTPYYLPLPEPENDGEGHGLIDMQNLDEYFKEAAELVVVQQTGSTSFLQRKLGIGFARAGKLMDQLQAAGVVGPADGAKPREVLIKDLDSLKSEIFDHFLR